MSPSSTAPTKHGNAADLQVIEMLKWVGVPGTPTHFALCLGAGAFFIYVWPRSRKLGRICTSLVLIVHVVLALPSVAIAIANRLPVVPQPLPEAVGKLDALIVFDGDNRRGRVAKASQIYATSSPSELWILGERMDGQRARLRRQGCKPAGLRLMNSSANTREQVAWVQRREANEPWAPVRNIALRLQVPRHRGPGSGSRRRGPGRRGADRRCAADVGNRHLCAGVHRASGQPGCDSTRSWR